VIRDDPDEVMSMARVVRRDGPAIVALRTEGAVIIPKALRNRLGLRPGDLLEVDVQGGNVILRPRPMGRLVVFGVPAASAGTLVGAVKLGGDALKDKRRLYHR